MKVGLDTGFLLKLYEGDERSRGYADKLADGKWRGVVSAISWYEFPKVLMRRGIGYGKAIRFLKDFCKGVIVVELKKETFARASKISMGLGLPALDALILTGFMEEGCEALITTDSDFERVKGIDVLFV